jgi:predicted membrane protein
METKYSREQEKSSTGTGLTGRFWAGLVLVVVGSLLLAREMGVYFPRWFFSWEMLLIAFGIFTGARHSFRSWGWLIPIVIGGAFLLDDFVPELELRHFIWPGIIIAIGLVMILRPRKSTGTRFWDNNQGATEGGGSNEDVLDTVSVFGGTKKNVISKNFRGGEVVNFFGGTDLNLSQSDINGVAVLDLTQVFGGTKLIVPSNWKVQSEVVAVFGGLDDKRRDLANPDPNKVLVLKGTCIFGGIDIKSF